MLRRGTQLWRGLLACVHARDELLRENLGGVQLARVERSLAADVRPMPAK
jgi:hypothetical protein